MNYNDFVNAMQGEKYLNEIGNDLRKQVRQARLNINVVCFVS